jgi:hypothetical protein
MSGAGSAGLFLRRQPESLRGYVAQVVLRRLSDAEMGIDLRDSSLGDSHRRPACPVVALWTRELIRPLGKRTGARRVSIGLAAGPYRHRVGWRRAKGQDIRLGWRPQRLPSEIPCGTGPGFGRGFFLCNTLRKSCYSGRRSPQYKRRSYG